MSDAAKNLRREGLSLFILWAKILLFSLFFLWKSMTKEKEENNLKISEQCDTKTSQMILIHTSTTVFSSSNSTNFTRHYRVHLRKWRSHVSILLYIFRYTRTREWLLPLNTTTRNFLNETHSSQSPDVKTNHGAAVT